MTKLSVTARIETWPIAGAFTIARGAKREAVVVVAEVSGDGATGCGECVPYARYGESVEGVHAAILAQGPTLPADRDLLQSMMPAGAARNALDCALWDWQAKRDGRTVAQLAGLPPSHALTTAYTISLGEPEEMARAAAAAAATLPLLKLKLGGDGDAARLAAIRAACPHTRLIADANESWRPQQLAGLMGAAAQARIEVIEQPLPADSDGILANTPRPVPVCADESLHTRADIGRLAARYDAVNIKLDKAGGLTEALALARAARAHGLKIMAGCMVATSLSMAPAVLLAQQADWVDLDGPLLLARDRSPGMRYERATVFPPSPQLWG